MNESPCGLRVVLSVFFHTCGPLNCEHDSSAAQFLEAVGQNITLPLRLHWTTRENNKTTGLHLVAAIFTKAHIQINALAVKHCPMWLFTKTAQAFRNHNICTVFVFDHRGRICPSSVCCKEKKWIQKKIKTGQKTFKKPSFLSTNAWHYLRITVGNTLLPNHVFKEPPH